MSRGAGARGGRGGKDGERAQPMEAAGCGRTLSLDPVPELGVLLQVRTEAGQRRPQGTGDRELQGTAYGLGSRVLAS